MLLKKLLFHPNSQHYIDLNRQLLIYLRRIEIHSNRTLLKPFPLCCCLRSPQAYKQKFFLNSNGKKSCGQTSLETWPKGRTQSTAAQVEAGDETSTTVELHSTRYCMQHHECSRGTYIKSHQPSLLYETVRNYGPQVSSMIPHVTPQ